MRRTYITPKATLIACNPCNIPAASTEGVAVHNGNTGGDDGQGGYDPGNSLSRDNGSLGNGLWDNIW